VPDQRASLQQVVAQSGQASLQNTLAQAAQQVQRTAAQTTRVNL
jgi:hypothetical protein